MKHKLNKKEMLLLVFMKLLLREKLLYLTQPLTHLSNYLT